MYTRTSKNYFSEQLQLETIAAKVDVDLIKEREKELKQIEVRFGSDEKDIKTFRQSSINF